jgi:ABC-type multidrug transport system ATPase subunit
MAHVSTLVAIYQASESLYNLFDKVVLLTEGKCAYFGPSVEARAYFENLGFECPPRWTTADFLTSVTEPHARRAKPGWEDRIPRSAEDFKQAYERSHVYQTTLDSIAEFEEETTAQADERAEARAKAPKKNFTIPFHRQVLALTRRQFLVMIGDKQSLFGKWTVITFLAVIVGSLFYDLPSTA